MHDFVVAGAGPVGSYLSMKLAENHNVILLEEHKEIGKPVACSGMVSNQLWNFIPMNQRLVQNKIKGVRANLNKTYKVLKNDVEAFVLDRAALDRYVANLAKKNGVVIKTGSRLSSFVVNEHVKSTVNNETIESKMLAGCDGPLSIVRRDSDIKNPNFIHGIFGYTEEDNFDDLVDVWYDVPGFFSWKVPRGKAGTEWGLAVDPKLNANKFYEEFKKKHNIEPKNVHSGLIPWGNIPLIGNRTFLCGDAGSQVKPYSGGGIMYGILGGNIAAKTIDPNNPNSLKKYQKEWNNKMGRELWLGKRMKWLYSHKKILGKCMWMLEKMNHEKLHMDKPSTILKR